MKSKFDLKQALSDRRESVIAKYNALADEKYFDGCTLRNFMLEILNMCVMNNIRSDKRLDNLLPDIMGNIYFNHSKITDAWIVRELSK